MAFRFAEFNAPTSTGTADYEISGMGQPAGCLIWMCRGGTAPNSGSDAIWSHGALDGTNEWVASGFVPNASTASRYGRYTRDSCVLLIDSSGGVNGEMIFDSWATNGVTLDCTTPFPGSAGDYKLIIAFWTGADFECGVHDPSDYPEAVTTSFRPQGLVTVHSIGNAWDDTAQSGAGFYNIGYAGWDSAGTLSQGSVNWANIYNSGLADWRANQYVSDTAIFQFFDPIAGTSDDEIAVTSRTSTSFTVSQTTSVSGGIYDFGWAVFGDSPETQVSVGMEVFGAGTGSETFSGYDGTINSLLVATTIATPANAMVTNFTASAVGVGGGSSSTEEFSQFVGCRDGTVGTCKSGHATTFYHVEGFSGLGGVRRQTAELEATSFDVADEWDANDTGGLAVYFVALATAPGTADVNRVVILGNTAILGNASIAGL